jgi:hypothetical protein
LLLFTAEKFAAVDDKLTKKALFAVGVQFSRRSAEAWLWSLQVYEGCPSLPLKLIIVAKTMRIMMSLIIKPGDPHMKKFLLILFSTVLTLTAYP